MELWNKKIVISVLLVFLFNTSVASYSITGLFSHAASSLSTTVSQEPGRCIATGLLSVGFGLMNSSNLLKKKSMFSHLSSSNYDKVRSFVFSSVIYGYLGWVGYQSFPKITATVAILWGVVPIGAWVYSKMNRKSRFFLS